MFIKYHYTRQCINGADESISWRTRELLANKSLTVWILGFCTFAAALTTFHAMLLQTQYGPTATFETYVLSPFIGPIQVVSYFWASLVLACALFGATSFAAFRYSHEFDTLIKLGSVMNHNTKQLTALLSENSRAMEEVRQGLSESMDTKINNLKQEMVAQIGKQQKIVQSVEEGAEIATGTKKELKATAKRPSLKPKVTLNDNPRKIKGVGPRLAQKLNEIGVTDIGKLITTDSMTIALGTQLLEDKVRALQVKAKILTMPSLDQKELELLEQMGITSK